MIIISISVTPIFRGSFLGSRSHWIANCQCECESNANCNVYAGCLWPNAVAGRKKHVFGQCVGTLLRPFPFPPFPPLQPFDLSRLSLKRTSTCWLSAFNPNVNVWRLNWPEKRVLWPPSQPQSSSSLKMIEC